MTAIRDRARRIIATVVRMPRRARARAAARRAASRTREQDLVVIVTHVVWVRVAKIAMALRLSGMRVVLIHSDDGFDRIDPEIRGLFDRIASFDSSEDAVIKAASFSPIAYHVLCNWNYEVARMLVRMRPGVVVIDTKDVIGGFVRPKMLKIYPGRASDERYCFENADGVCCSDLRTQFLKRERGYRFPPRLLWLDYCWPEGFVEGTSGKAPGKHVVCVGSMETDPQSPLAYGYWLGRLLAEQGIDLHIFPSSPGAAPKLRAGMASTLSPDQAKHVHVHDTQPFLALARRMSSFHAGVLISSSSADYSGENETYYPFLADYLIASRLFDYLEAGLVILMQPMRIPKRLFRQPAAVREVRTLDDIVQIASQTLVAPTVPRTLRLDHHAGRLREFYRKLHGQPMTMRRR